MQEEPKLAQDTKLAKKGVTRADLAKFSVLIAIVAASIAATVALWPFIAQLTTQEGIDSLVATVQSAGPLAVMVLLGLQLAQVVIAFIPGEVVQIASGILYGPLWGSVIVLAGACLSTIIIYFLVRKLGTPFVSKMVPVETQRRFGFLNDSSALDLLVFLVFLIPALPKDALTYVVALTAIKPWKFFLLSTLGRAPGVVMSAIMGSSIAEGNWTMFIVIGAVAVVVLAVFFVKRDWVFAKLGGGSDE